MTNITSNISHSKYLRNILGFAAGALITLLSATQVQASTQINKTFEFGGDSPQTRSHMRTFSIPANSTVSVAVDVVENPNHTPLAITVHRPDANSISNTGPDGPRVGDPLLTAGTGVIAYQNTSFSSTFGCPSTWRVRVQTADGSSPSVKISGTIIVIFNPPPASNLSLPGGDQDIANSSIATRIVSGIIGKGSGTVRLKAKWHSPFADFRFYPLTVRLLRPDGTIAQSQTGYSQHADKTPKLNFTYDLTPTDLALTGDWKVQISNNSGQNLFDFDVRKGGDLNPLVPNFNSTFTPVCN